MLPQLPATRSAISTSMSDCSGCAKHTPAEISDRLSSMGLTGTCFLRNSDGSFDHSFCIRSRIAVERLTFANPVSSVASLRLCPPQQGSDAARAVLRGILEGAYGVLIFYTIVAGGLGHLSPILVYAAAILASLLVSVPWLKSKLVLPAE
jgi:hypothetical protein